MRETGRVVQVDASGISIEAEGERRRFAREDVRRVDLITEEPDSVQNGLLAGTVIGGLPGLYLWAGSAKTSDPFGPAPMVVGALVGAGIGALVDFARDGPRVTTVYLADR